MYLKDFDCLEKQNEQKTLEVSLIPYNKSCFDQTFDFDRAIYDLDNQIKMLSSRADTLDYYCWNRLIAVYNPRIPPKNHF